MNRKQLVEAISSETGMPPGQVDLAVRSMLRQTALAVRKGEPVQLVGFGTFERRDRKARRARNPRTGTPIKVKAAKVPAFRAGAALKQIVQTGRAAGHGASGWASPTSSRTGRTGRTGGTSRTGTSRTGMGRRVTGTTRTRTSGRANGTRAMAGRGQQTPTARAASGRNAQRGSRRRG